jgi:hypothetical protein
MNRNEKARSEDVYAKRTRVDLIMILSLFLNKFFQDKKEVFFIT